MPHTMETKSGIKINPISSINDLLSGIQDNHPNMQEHRTVIYYCSSLFQAPRSKRTGWPRVIWTVWEMLSTRSARPARARCCWAPWRGWPPGSRWDWARIIRWKQLVMVTSFRRKGPLKTRWRCASAWPRRSPRTPGCSSVSSSGCSGCWWRCSASSAPCPCWGPASHRYNFQLNYDKFTTLQ